VPAVRILVVLALCLLLPASASAAVLGNPMAGVDWFVDPGSAAARAQLQTAVSGDLTGAAQLDMISHTPQATWFIAVDDPFTSGYVHEFVQRWRADGSKPIAIALHGLPNQVCAGDNAPGHRAAADYRRWIDHWARWIGGHQVTVFLEPDGLAASKCMPRALRDERIGLMAYAARTLSQQPQTAVYEDIGAGDWLKLREAARLLKQAGVGYARGFSLNVTHFDWTSAEVAYGNKLSRMVGGKHFVVNTSANGLGPEIGPRNYHMWCNPRGRALGPLPTVQTASGLADAYFWIANPGLSDGTCNGGPTVGTFWLQWALELAGNATRAPDFPVPHKRR
jgi:endoglucanase